MESVLKKKENLNKKKKDSQKKDLKSPVHSEAWHKWQLIYSLVFNSVKVKYILSVVSVGYPYIPIDGATFT